ncbi:hypothetical protein ACIQFW_04305 [Streptomyces ardesiacus]|uniref:hypothetical protein n=1 Tax=Streptomyces ardesiacus TaxID=285564 RepID=UPI003808F020
MTDPTTLRDRIAAALYDHSHPGWAISFPDLDQDQRDTYLARADAALAELPRRTAGDVAAVIGPTMLLGLQDAELDGEGGTQRIHDWIKWISEAVAALPAVLPATTNHDTDTSGFELRGDTEIRAAALREVEAALSERAKRLTGEFNDSDILHEDGPAATVATWKQAAELVRRVADETAATETQAHEPLHQWRVEILDGDEWMPASGLRRDRSQAAEQLRMSSERRPLWKDGTQVQRRLVRETTTYTVEAGPTANCSCGVLRTGPGRHLPECPNRAAAGARRDGEA